MYFSVCSVLFWFVCRLSQWTLAPLSNNLSPHNATTLHPFIWRLQQFLKERLEVLTFSLYPWIQWINSCFFRSCPYLCQFKLWAKCISSLWVVFSLCRVLLHRMHTWGSQRFCADQGQDAPTESGRNVILYDRLFDLISLIKGISHCIILLSPVDYHHVTNCVYTEHPYHVLHSTYQVEPIIFHIKH